MLAGVEKDIAETRKTLATIDEMTWKEGLVKGAENHLWLVRASDMLGDYREYHDMAQAFIAEISGRKKSKV